MKKKNLRTIFFVVVLAFVTGYNVYSSQRSTEMSDIALANVEALAWDEMIGTDMTYRLYPCPHSARNECVMSDDIRRETCSSSSHCN